MNKGNADYTEVLKDFETLISEHVAPEIPKEAVLSFMVIAYNQGMVDGMAAFKKHSSEY